jgi:glycosyltransferase involved in cell wall biosynthesis
MMGMPADEPNEALICRQLRERFDGVVMLTWSNWRGEPRSNRYHYATRFARHLPVLFVQQGEDPEKCQTEPTEVDNVTVLHLPRFAIVDTDGRDQVRLLSQALRKQRIVKPLLWTYNPYFRHFVRVCYAGLKVYHATEDYFGDAVFNREESLLNVLREVLRPCDLVVAVSEGVAEQFREQARFRGRIEVATNGCDHAFFAAAGPVAWSTSSSRPVACYQGGINYRLDFTLLDAVAELLPDWDFVFLGKTVFGPDHIEAAQQWYRLLRRRNVRYLGELSADGTRLTLQAATVGLIPFGPNESIRQRSFPLKAFEYVASGLPVVTVPIEALRRWPDLFTFAESPAEFARAIEQAPALLQDQTLQERRKAEARAESYERKFACVCQALHETPACLRPTGPLKVLVLYDAQSLHVKTIEHHLRSFALFSENRISYLGATGAARSPGDLSYFDVVVIHYSIRVCIPSHLSPSFEEALRAFAGLKVLFVQDEYDHTDLTCNAIESLGVQLVYSCVPAEAVRQVYPASRFPQVEFLPTLTGYVPLDVTESLRPRPLAKRKNLLGYRGRDIGFWYGHLARDKAEVGRRMKAVCEEMGVPCDIAWDTASRIYGQSWFEFLGNCRATLGTESGSNVFDFDGSLRRLVEEELRARPDATYEEVHAKYLAEHEGKIVQNQISPKVFEAIACRTALVLLEGRYSDVLTPGIHYLPLKKDYSNARLIVEQLQDDTLIEGMTQRAYQDIIASGRYSYARFVQDFDAVLRSRLGRPASPLVRWARARRDGQGRLPAPPPEAFPPPPASPGRPSWWLRGRRVVADQLARVRLAVVNQLGLVSKLGRLAAAYLGQPTVRRTFHSYLGRRSVRRAVSLGSLVSDLLRLDLLRRLRRRHLQATPEFAVAIRFPAGSSRLKLVSLAEEDDDLSDGPAQKAATPPPNWEAIRDALRGGNVQEILWDHSAIGTSCAARRRALRLQYWFGSDGLYRFSGLLAVSRCYPDQVVRMLRAALGPLPDPDPARPAGSGSGTHRQGR